MVFVNENSFLLSAIGLGLLLVLGVWGWRPKLRRIVRFGILTLYIIVVITFSLVNRFPADANASSVNAVEATLGDGRPTFVMLYSNYCLACLSSLSAVRGLKPQLDAAQINALLIDVQSDTGRALLDRFAFRATPTYILYDSAGQERWRGAILPGLSDIKSDVGLVAS